MTIRKATKKDVAIIWKMTRELSVYEKFPGEACITKTATAKIFFGKHANTECYLIEYNGKVIGMGKLLTLTETWTGESFFLLRDFYIREKYRGKGHGQDFMKFAVKLTLKRRYSGIQWNVFNWNKPAINFYKKMGATVVRTTRMRIDSARLKEITG